jgi:2-polyprenyl-3-methyl-5-hydroxy-6-metoxy-1,4-benzoquinol methylase
MIAENNIQTWEEAQTWEKEWHDKQQFNTYNEETKQYIYASLMGLNQYKTNYYGIVGWDFGEQSVLDVGGGESSILLKSNASKKVVVDPLDYPNWVKMRYAEARINFQNIKAEKINFSETFDIGLLYNCLQHTEYPNIIANKMRKYCKVIHVFEWINEGVSDGHIHNLTEGKLNEWFGGEGKTGALNQYPCIGQYYCGVFKGEYYE